MFQCPQTEIQDGLLKVTSKYVHVTADARNKICTERRHFFKEILCANLGEFNANKKRAPLCAVYTSQTECVGK